MKEGKQIRKSKLKKQSFVEDLYQTKTKIKDNRFGEVTFWSKKKGKDLLLMKKRISTDESGCEMDVMQAKERLKLNHNFLMKMVDFSVKVNPHENFEVWGFYQAPLQDLRKEIEKRKKIQRSESYIIYLNYL